MELILLKYQWMDDPNKAARVDYLKKTKPGFLQKWERRYMKGDVIERRPDGYYSGRQLSAKEQAAFVVVCVPGVDIPDITEPLMRNDGITEDKRRKYNVDINDLGQIETLSNVELALRLKTKTVDIMFR